MPDDRTSAEPPRQTHDKTVAAQGEAQRAVPRMPHERDESADEQAGAALSDPVGALAHADAVRGLPDTSRAAQTDETYHRLRAADGSGRAKEEKESPRGPGAAPGLSPPGPGASRR